MRLARIALCLGSIALPGWGSAQTWEVGYDASLGTLPSAQGWTASGDESVYSVQSGVLVQQDAGPFGTRDYSIRTPASDLDADVIVIEARLRIVSSTVTAPGSVDPQAGYGIQLVDEDGDRIVLFIAATGVLLRGAVNGPEYTSLEPFDATAGFADYRLRIDRDGATVHVDGDELLRLGRDRWTSTGLTANRVRFGDLSSTQSSHSQLQSLRVSRFHPPAAEVRNYRTVSAFSAFDSSAKKSLDVDCPEGMTVLAGGVETIGAQGSVAISDSLPNPTGPSTSTRWYGAAREIVDTSANWQIRVDAICGEIAGYAMEWAGYPESTDAVQGETGHPCNEGRSAFSGGAGAYGADLRQALITTSFLPPYTPNPGERVHWWSAVRDLGALGSSSAAWGRRSAVICSDVPRFEHVSGGSFLGSLSVREASVNCPAGKVPIGGGARIADIAGDGQSALRASQPKEGTAGGPFVGWTATAQSTSSNWRLEVDVLCAPLADATVTANGLVGRWKGEFDATDSWGIRHGELHDGVAFDPAVFGQGFRFDSIPETQAVPWVEIRNSPFGSDFAPVPTPEEEDEIDLYPADSFSVDAWIVTDTPTPTYSPAIVNLYEFGGTTSNPNCSGWQITLTPEGLALVSARPASLSCISGVATGSTSVVDGQPHHLLLRRDEETRRLSLWVDGARVNETTLSIDGSSGPLLPSNSIGDPVAIGAWREAATSNLIRPFIGLIDDVKYYNRALSDEEIRESAGCALPIVPRTLNLDAARFGQPSLGPAGLCVFLEEGRYRLTLLSASQNAGARFTAWSPSPAHPWSTVYAVRGEIDPGLVAGFPTGSDTPQEAFDATTTREATLSLSADQRVYFSVIDAPALDNRGGVSIQIEAAPPDTDGDAIEDPDDNCPAFANAAQSDVDANGIGDLCECGDQNGDGRVNVLDLIAINLAIFNPSQVTPLCDTNEDDLCNVLDIIGANLKIFGQPAYCSRYPSGG
jgi:hypothetical protein